jgi:hypothetical protein
MERLTYKSAFGDYGTLLDCVDDHANLCRLYNRLGAYEDIGTVEQFRTLRDRFLDEQAEAPAPMHLGPCQFSPGDLSACLDMEGWCK